MFGKVRKREEGSEWRDFWVENMYFTYVVRKKTERENRSGKKSPPIDHTGSRIFYWSRKKIGINVMLFKEF